MTECAHGGAPGRSDAQVRAALDDAEARLEAVGERWTEPRRRAFELLLQSPQPLKAYDVFAKFKPGAPISPPTVYRALEFLMGRGLIHHLESLHAYVVCTDHGDAPRHEAQFLICDCCGAVAEVQLDTGGVVTAAEGGGFEVRDLLMELRGRCRSCR